MWAQKIILSAVLLIGLLLIGLSTNIYVLLLVRTIQTKRKIKPHTTVVLVTVGILMSLVAGFSLYRAIPSSYNEAKDRLSDPSFSHYFRKDHASYAEVAPNSPPLNAPEFLPGEKLWPLYQQMINENTDEETRQALVAELQKKSRFQPEIGGAFSRKYTVDLAPAPGEFALVCIRWLNPIETKTEYRIDNKSTFAPITLHYGQIFRSKERVLFDRFRSGEGEYYHPILGHEPAKSWPVAIGERISVLAEDVEPQQDCLFYVTYRTGPDNQMKYAHFVVSSFRTELDEDYRLVMFLPWVLFPMGIAMAIIYFMLFSEKARSLIRDISSSSKTTSAEVKEAGAEPIKGEVVAMKNTRKGEIASPENPLPPKMFDRDHIRQDLDKIKSSKTKLATYFARARSIYTIQAQREYLEELEKAYDVETTLLQAEIQRLETLREREIALRKLETIEKDIEISDKEKELKLAEIRAKIAEQVKQEVLHGIDVRKAELELEQMRAKPEEEQAKAEEDFHDLAKNEVQKDVALWVDAERSLAKAQEEIEGLVEDRDRAKEIIDDIRTSVQKSLRRDLDE